MPSRKLPTFKFVPAVMVVPKVKFVVLATNKINPVVGKLVVALFDFKAFDSKSYETV